jgi:hypothetical protein
MVSPETADHAEVTGIGKGYGGRSDQTNKHEILVVSNFRNLP